ncbi:MAG: response regulator [Candidatus Goldbacteria bacterium]|nr:response regulator [Candidatus Goldiibacteriota bacterium]
MENEKSKNVLLIEDNKADVRLITEALTSFNTRKNVYNVSNGIEAMHFLRQQEEYKNFPRPDIIILDLNLPGKNGFEILKEIKEDERTKKIPVVVLSVSNSSDDIDKSYLLQANCYITKSMNLDDFIKDVKKIDDFWLNSVRLPGEFFN